MQRARSESLGPICPLEALPFGPPSSPVSIVKAQDMLLGVRCMCVCLSLPHVLPNLPISWVPRTSMDRR